MNIEFKDGPFDGDIWQIAGFQVTETINRDLFYDPAVSGSRFERQVYELESCAGYLRGGIGGWESVYRYRGPHPVWPGGRDYASDNCELA